MRGKWREGRVRMEGGREGVWCRKRTEGVGQEGSRAILAQ